MAVRAAQSLQAEKPLKKKVFANRAIPHRKRQTAWTALSCSKLLFHAATWGRMSSTSWKAIDNKYHSGLRMVLARPKAQGARTNLGVRADAMALPLDDLVATRRLGFAKRALDHAPPWFMGLIQSTDRAPRSWTKLIRTDLEWLDASNQAQLSPLRTLSPRLQTLVPTNGKAGLRKSSHLAY